MEKLFLFIKILLSAFLLSLVFACGEQKTYRDTMSKQDDKFTQTRQEELQPAEGTFRGTVSLRESHQEFNCVVEIRRTSEFVRIAQSQDQTETGEVPKLSGSLRFPILDHLEPADRLSYTSLTDPMGGYYLVTFNSGNYNPRSTKMILPYSVPANPQNNLGQLEGSLKNKRFQGVWFSIALGNVGQFDLTLVESK